MEKQTTIKLDEEDVILAIKDYVVKHHGSVLSMRFHTSVRGDYDKGNAEEYVESVYCTIGDKN